MLTSTSPVRSLYLSLMTGSAGFSLRVLERSLKVLCSGAGEGGERPISLSPRLWLRLWEPDVTRRQPITNEAEKSGDVGNHSVNCQFRIELIEFN